MNVRTRILSIAAGSVYLLCITVFSTGIGYAQDTSIVISDQQYVSQKWDNTRGLPVNTVFNVVKDETGYLWAATEEGLVRFDGVNFRTYNQDNVPGVVSSMFYDLKKSSDGGVWAANANRIVHAKSNRVRAYDASDYVEGTWITSIAEDHEGNVWAGTNSGDLLILQNGSVQAMTGWDEYKSGAVITIELFSDGMMVGTQNGLFKYIHETEEFEELTEYRGIEVRAVAETPGGNLWVGTRTRGLFHHLQDSVVTIDESNGLANNKVNTLRLSEDGRVWTGLGVGGVQVISKSEITSLREIEFGYNEVNDILITEYGHVWLSATGHGIIQMIPADIRMLRQEDGLSNDITLAIYQDSRGVVWSGTAGAGVNRIENGNITGIASEHGLRDLIILSVYGVDEYIYVGTGGGLHRFNPETGSVDRHFSTDDGLANNIVQAIYQDSQENVWVTTRSGGIHRLHNHEELERLELPSGFDNAEFISILEDSNGNIWFSTTSTGILKIDLNDNVTAYSVHHGPSSEMVLSLYEDPEGSIWAGTNEGMLVLRDNGEFSLFNRRNGLQFNGIFRMIEDDYGYLWASGNFGIQRIRIDDLLALKHDEAGDMRIPVRLFDTSDGMANHEANGGVFPAGWKMESGEIWFPTMQGIAQINPAALIDSEADVEVQIESLNFGGKEFTGVDEISIPPGVHSVEIHYGSFDFKKPHTINYSFRISGLSDEWQSAGNRRTAYLTTLNPGKYTFEVKAEQFGRESDIASIGFSVEPFFYQTYWFRFLILLGLFAAGFLAKAYHSKIVVGKKLRHRVDRQTKELQDRNRKMKEVMGELENQNRVLKKVAWIQSHELRGPLSRMLVLLDVVKNYEQFTSVGKDRDQLIAEIDQAAVELDDMIRKMNSEIDQLDPPEEK